MPSPKKKPAVRQSTEPLGLAMVDVSMFVNILREARGVIIDQLEGPLQVQRQRAVGDA